jgi:hypothetical protein
MRAIDKQLFRHLNFYTHNLESLELKLLILINSPNYMFPQLMIKITLSFRTYFLIYMIFR